MKSFRFRAITGMLVSATIASGCYTTTNTVTMQPLSTKYPVSASGQYLDAEGRIVKEDDYAIVESFEFDKRVEAPRHETKETPLSLEPELNRLVAKHRGDAITDLKVAGTDYDTGSHGSAASWKVLGWTFGLTGATFVVLGAAIDDDSTGAGGSLMTAGAVIAGLGVVSYLLSYAANDPASWNIHVQGNVVKRGGVENEAAKATEDELAHFLAPAEIPEGALLVPVAGFRPIALSSTERAVAR